MSIATLWVAVVAIVLAYERFFPESHETTFSDYEAARDACLYTLLARQSTSASDR